MEWAGASSEAASRTVQEIPRQKKRLSGRTKVAEAKRKERQKSEQSCSGRKVEQQRAKTAKGVAEKSESIRVGGDPKSKRVRKKAKQKRRKMRVPVVVCGWGEVSTVSVASCD